MNWTDYHVIQLFKIEKNKEITLIWYKLLSDWGVRDIRWKDDKIIYIQKESIKKNDKDTIFAYKTYVKFPLEKYLD